jgi:hypothetical protein
MRRAALVVMTAGALLAFPAGASAITSIVDTKLISYDKATGATTGLVCQFNLTVTAQAPPRVEGFEKGVVYGVVSESVNGSLQALGLVNRAAQGCGSSGGGGGLPGQTPGMTPGFTPGQTIIPFKRQAGFTPGQTGGQTPGQSPGQTPGGGSGGTNTAPTCPASVSVRIAKNGSAVLNHNCEDPDGDNVLFLICPTCSVKHSTIVLGAALSEDEEFSIRADRNYTGSDQMRYFVEDEFGKRSNTTTLNISIESGISGGGSIFKGTKGNDIFDGTALDDLLNGGRGDDELNGGRGNDTLNGGPGDDEADGGPGNDDIDGGPGADDLSGGTGNDEITDTSASVAGVSAKAKGNKVFGGSGKDKINVKNRRKDKVDCGTGKDAVTADKQDKVAKNCEKVKKPKKKPKKG